MANKATQRPATTVVTKAADATPSRAKSLRRIRDWRERFDESAPYVFNRQALFDGKVRQVGDRVPSNVHRRKLRALWDARRIRRADLVVAT